MKKIKLADFDPNFSDRFDKEKVEKQTQACLTKMAELLYRMYAENKRSLLIILQGIDTSGKDGTIKHIFSGSNPQGVRVHSFKQPSEEELRHDFLWRCHKECPLSGEVAIFNRSYYEEVTTLKVHREGLRAQHLPEDLIARKDFFEMRYEQINHFEKILVENGTVVIKLLLHISKDEQKRRLEARIADPSKNWKFSKSDIQERKFWDDYMQAFDQMLTSTHTSYAPWSVIPANKKWYRNFLSSKTIVDNLDKLNLKFPQIKIKNLKIK